MPTGKTVGLRVMSIRWLMSGSKMLWAPRWGLILVLAAVWAAMSGAVKAATFTVSLDPTTMTLGESTTLTLTFDGGPPATTPVVPDIPNLDISSPPNRSSEYSFVNGVTSTIEKYSYTVTPIQPGDYTIPALRAQIGPQIVVSQPVKLTVLKQTVTTGADNGDAQAFLRLVVPKQKVFVGEVIQAELELCLREDVVDIRNASLTPISANGFTMGKSVQGQPTGTRIGNANYRIIPIHQVFTAAKVGSLTLGPANCSLDLLLGPVNFFGQPTRSQHVALTTDPIAIQSLPLPVNGQPPGFNGAVGSYSLAVSASPTNIAVGDPITVTVQISGHGAVDSLTLPDQPGWQKFKLYPPTSDYQTSDQQLDLSGTKTFKLTAVPQSMDIAELPPFSFSFFDPELNNYRTLTQPAIPLILRPSAASLPPPSLTDNSTATDNPQARQDIMPIKPWLGTLSTPHTPLVTQPWFLAAQSLPVLVFFGLLVYRRQEDRLAANPRLRRHLKVEQTIRIGLKELRGFADANQPEDFFVTMFRLLQERLGERLDLPASAITEAIVEERLIPLGAPEQLLAELRELFQICNQVRYAPQTSAEELVSLIPRVETVLHGLKDLKS
jgi:BatD DUF11 like domain